MASVYGIVTSSGNHFKVEGLEKHRPIGAFSFLGRYRIVDFALSNLSNSNIDRIQVYVSQNPRSLAEHVGNGSHYNINSKRGKLQLLFNQDSRVNEIYNTDVAAYRANLEIIGRMHQEYVIITPGYMVFKQNFNKLVEEHIASGADVTVLYHKVNNGKSGYRGLDVLSLNRQKGVTAIKKNIGTADNLNIFMDTYVMSKEIFVDLITKAHNLSSMYNLVDITNIECSEMDIRAVAHKGYFSAITDLTSYYKANEELLDYSLASTLFNPAWPIYTKTTDSCPTQYFEGASVCNSYVSNACLIEGTVENSVIGRSVKVAPGAVVKNCVVLAYAEIGTGVHLENQIVDKWAQVIHAKEVIGSPDKPGYIRRDDTL